MPLISSLSAGLKISSSGNNNALGEIKLAAANPIFNSQYTATGFTNVTGAGTNGTGQAAVFTVNPSAQANGTIGMIIDGKALQLYVEYNSLGQFRFDVLPSGVAAQSSTGALTSPSLTSAWYPVGTEHTVGVSYNTAGYLVMVVDGDFSSATTLSQVSTDPVNITQMTSSANTGTIIGGLNGFNGFVGQVINFRGPLSPTELASVTQDPAGVANSLGGTITPAATGHIENAFPARGVGADILTNGILTSRTFPGTVDTFLEAAPGTINGAAAIGTTILTVSTIANYATAGVQNANSASAGNIRPGDYITGAGIPDGTYVTAVTSATSITLRNPITAALTTGGVISVYHPEAVVRQEILTSTSPTTPPTTTTTPTAAQLGFTGGVNPTLGAGEIVLRLDSIAGIRGGDLVAGGGLPGGYQVTATGIIGSTDSVVITPVGVAAATSPVNSGSAIYFVNPNARDAQSINIASNNTATGAAGYVAGDSIQITAASGPNGALATRTYVVQASDILSTPALTNAKIANSIVTNNPTIGLYALAQNSGGLTNQIVMAPMLSTGPTIDTSTANLAGTNTPSYVLPPVVVRSLNTAQVNENNVLDALNLSNIPAGTLASSTFQGSSSYTPLVSSAFGVATLANTASATLSSANGAINAGSQTYTGTSNSTTAVPVLKGPFYTELVSYSSSQTTGSVYNVFINPSFVAGPLRSVGFTLAASSTAPSGKILSLVPAVAGSLTQSNVATDGSNVNFQWVSSTAVTDYTQPIARLTVANTDSSQSSFASTISSISINGGYTMDRVTPSMTMVQAAALPSQVYSITGTAYQQYTKGTTSPDLGYTSTAAGLGQQVVIPGTDMTYTVKSGASNLNLNLQPITTPVTSASPNPVVKIDVVDTLLAPGTNTFSYNINVPSNASNPSFTPGLGVSGVTVVNNGSFLTVSGTYGGSVTTTTTTGTPPVTTTVTTPAVLQNTNTPTLGTLTVTLNSMMTTVNGLVSGGGNLNNASNPSKGAQFSIDSALLNGAPATAQSLYFGAAETNANGVYTLSNLPLGQLSLNVYNNASQAASKVGNISLNDAMSALTMAAGRGVVTSTVVGTATTLDVSDFLAADFNKDGRVTAADSLAILQYFVNYSNLNSAPLSYTYFPASQQGSTGVGKVGVGSATAPAMTAITTNINASNSTTLGIGGSQTLDIVGVLQGDVISG